MGLITWKGLLAHKLRLALTALAVVLGVAFVAGTFILTDTIENAFDRVIASTAGGVDVQVRPDGAGAGFTSGFGPAEADTVPPEVLDEVAAVDGVAVADPEVWGTATLLDGEGDPIGGMGPPTIGANAPPEPGLGGTELREGRFPEREGEVAIDAFTARTQDFGVGDTVHLVTTGPVEEADVVGVVGFDGADNLAGATVTLFDLDTALDRYSDDGSFASVEVQVEDGASTDAVAGRIASAVGADYEVVTAEQLVEEGSAAMSEALGVFNTALLVFAAVALLVGAFIIFNTFSIIVAQRARELALLRAVGASRRQILASVVGEALGVGLFSAVVGLGAGIGLAVGLQTLLDTFGVALPTEGLVVAPRTVVVAVVVGLAVTAVAAILPAVRATRVLPVAALSAVAAPPPPRASRWRNAVGFLVLAAGVGLLAAGLFADAGLPAVGAGAVVVFLAVALVAPLFARPVVRGVGYPVAKLFGVRGQLARENAMRNPRRTASTASALMIGVGLVGFVTILAASITASITAAIDEVYLLDFDVRSTQFQPVADGVAVELEALPEVDVAAEQRFGMGAVDGTDRMMVGIDPDELGAIYHFEMAAGAVSRLHDGGVLVAESAAEREGVALGDELPVEFPAGAARLPVRGVFDGASVDVDYFLDDETYAEQFRDDTVFAVGVTLADQVAAEDGRAAIEGVLEAYPTLQALDQTGVRDNLVSQINQLLGLVYALLALSVVIALFGIVNTLALSVFERIRELGLLRAVGASRAQVRSMVRWEAVLIAILGALLGLGVGLLFGWLLVQAMADFGLSRFVVPGGQLVLAVVVAAIAGVVAGILPARRAARVDILRALAVE